MPSLAFLVECVTTLAVCYLASEWLYGGAGIGSVVGNKPWPLSPATLCLLALLNVLVRVPLPAAVVLASPESWGAWFLAPGTVLTGLPLSLLLGAAVFLILTCCHHHVPGCRDRVPVSWRAVAGVAGVVAAGFTWWPVGLSRQLDAWVCLRADIVVAIYVLGCFWDLCWTRPRLVDPVAFVPLLSKAAVIMVPIFPVVAIAIATVFLLLAGALDALRIDHDVLQWPIYFGVLYGPAACTYLIMKRYARANTMDLPR